MKDWRVQIVVYAVVLFLAYCEEQNASTESVVWYWSSRFWYGLAEFAGRMGMQAEQRYFGKVSVNG